MGALLPSTGVGWAVLIKIIIPAPLCAYCPFKQHIRSIRFAAIPGETAEVPDATVQENSICP